MRYVIALVFLAQWSGDLQTNGLFMEVHAEIVFLAVLLLSKIQNLGRGGDGG